MDHVLETERLILRPFTEEDYDVILQISSDPDTTKYLYFWGRDGMTPQQDAHRFLNHALKEWGRDKIAMREYCVILKATGERIGDASVEAYDDHTAEIGWILLPAFRGRGYATEAGQAMMDFGFLHDGAQRVIAHCDARNAPSYSVMKRLHMHLDRLEKEARLAKTSDEKRGDEATYGIAREIWAFARYRELNCDFERGFMALPELYDGDIRLICDSKIPANEEKGYVPSYHFLITRGSEKVGTIDLRIGYPGNLFFGGQIGYTVLPAFRGQGIAARACRLLSPVMAAHRMPAAVITNDVKNVSSRRVCEKLGCEYWCRVKLPHDNDMRLESGMDEVNVYAFRP